MSLTIAILLSAMLVSMFLVWFFSHRADHRERMFQIEKGMQPSDRRTKNRFSWLRLGLLLIGLSVGLLIISVLAATKLLDKGGNALPLAILGLSGGIAMIVAGRIENNSKRP